MNNKRNQYITPIVLFHTVNIHPLAAGTTGQSEGGESNTAKRMYLDLSPNDTENKDYE